MGKKKEVQIPAWILQNESFVKKCVRGIVDTDGTIRFRRPYRGEVHCYPEVKVTNQSLMLIKQLQLIFSQYGFNTSVFSELKESKFLTHYLSLNGVKNTHRYVNIFGFSNSKHMNKYLFWKEHGYYKNMAKVGNSQLLDFPKG